MQYLSVTHSKHSDFLIASYNSVKMMIVYLLDPTKLLETVTTVDAVAQVLLMGLDQQSLFWLP